MKNDDAREVRSEIESPRFHDGKPADGEQCPQHIVLDDSNYRCRRPRGHCGTHDALVVHNFDGRKVRW